MIIRVCRWCVNDLLCRAFDVISHEEADIYIEGDCPYFEIRDREQHEEMQKNGTRHTHHRSA